MNRRTNTICLLVLAGAALCALALAGELLAGRAMTSDFSRKDLAPCLAFPFGTDWMGRDMLARTLAGLSLSVRIGAVTALVSGGIALVLGTASAALGGWVDALVSWTIDMVMGIPHMLLIILISIACGRGYWGVTVGVALSHWPSLTRVLRGEMLQLRQAPYIQMSRRMGASWWKIARVHVLPHLLPQLLAGLVLQFPHAILHEAGATFLGFGLSPEQPAIGIILEESMGYLASGRWWLALFPGLCLMLTAASLALAGEQLRLLLSPASAQE